MNLSETITCISRILPSWQSLMSQPAIKPDSRFWDKLNKGKSGYCVAVLDPQNQSTIITQHEDQAPSSRTYLVGMRHVSSCWPLCSSCSPLWGHLCHETSALQPPKPQDETWSPDCGSPSPPVCSDCPRGRRAHQVSLSSSNTPGLKAPGISHQASFAFCTSQEQAKDLIYFVMTNLTSEKMSHRMAS